MINNNLTSARTDNYMYAILNVSEAPYFTPVSKQYNQDYKSLTNGSPLKKFHHSISYRSLKNFNETEFINDLSSTPWDVIKIFDDTNVIVESRSSLFFTLLLISIYL